eukprot:TRINITY_DN57249_c0_g1_i1.p1 TRINITY_DN57249_c0_g1~~TRINITY_DN57249_c0_g1_i1.p1  ORF type:complete len:280 (+),score=62.71 TRINITY_DN57249_c0_g1_i1:132-971(+)
MATWGTLGGAWQYAAGAEGTDRANLKLCEAFGANIQYPGADLFDKAPFAGAVRTDPANALADEVPRIFSMKAQPGGGLAGDTPATLQRPAGGDAIAGFGGGGLGGGIGGAIGGGLGGGLGGGGFMDVTGLRPPVASREGGASCWVTVFGFAGRSESLVRQQLETHCGPILQVVHGDGNSMHLRFHTSAAASQCLALNGRSLMNKIIIGCVPCTASFIDGRAEAGASAPAGGEEWSDAYGHVGGPPTGPRSAPPPPPAARGPRVQRGNLVWRMLDLIFDI